MATFEHSTSRAQDPQLHTHCLVANLAPREDGTCGTLDGRPLFRWKMALGALYRAELAEQLQARLPVEIERDGSGFAIRGVPEAVQAQFSKRAEQIQEWLAERGYHGAKAAQLAVLDTRPTKGEIDRPALFARWQDEGRAAGWGPEQTARWLAHGAWERDRPAEPALADVREGLVRQHSTFADRDAWRALAEGMQGAGGIRQIEARMSDFWRDPEVVNLGDDRRGETRWSTESLRRLEATALVRAEIGAEDRAHALSSAQIEPILQARPTLSAEQVEAVRYLCERSGAVATVEGLPGTGKSVLLDAAREAWETAGYTVVGAALSGQAALGLHASAGIPSATLHARLNEWAPAIAAPAAAPATAAAPVVNDGMLFANGGRPAVGSLDARTVVVVDEAGMVDSRTLAALIDATQTAGAKLVLVGDHRQLQPVEAGGLFRALAERIETANLTEIRRQAAPWAREAVHAVAEGRAGAALAAYEERGLLHVGDGKAETVEALVSAWAEAGRKAPGRVPADAGRRARRRAGAQPPGPRPPPADRALGPGPADRHGPRPARVRGRGPGGLHPQLHALRRQERPARDAGGDRVPARRDHAAGPAGRGRAGGDAADRALSPPGSRLRPHHPQGPGRDRGSGVRAGGRQPGQPGTRAGATEPAPPGRPGVRGSGFL